MQPAGIVKPLVELFCAWLAGVCLVRMAVLLAGYRAARSRAAARDQVDLRALIKSPLVPQVAVIAAAADASPATLSFVRHLLKLHFGNVEVIVALDGPAASDLAVWVEEFSLSPSARVPVGTLETMAVGTVYQAPDPARLLVVHKQRGGEADSLNAAMNFAAAPLVAVADRESVFAEDALLRLVPPFIEDAGHTSAVCSVTPVKPLRTLASRFYALESVQAWLSRREGARLWNSFLPAPGSFVLAKRRELAEAGGFAAGVAELLPQMQALERTAGGFGRIILVRDPVSWPRAPKSLGDVRERIRREQRGIARALLAARERSSPWKGRWSHFLLPGWRYLCPLVETAGLLLAAPGFALGWIAPDLAALALAESLVLDALVSMTAVTLGAATSDRDTRGSELILQFLCAVLASFGYRQWRIFQQIAHGLGSPERPPVQPRGGIRLRVHFQVSKRYIAS